jgi:23S rRNA A1618 N6-methylase RlmF
VTLQATNRGTVKDLPVAREAELQDQVRKLARANGVLHYHTHDSRRSEGGFPDTVLCGPGGVAFLELKRAKGSRTTAKQREWITRLTEAGQTARIVKPKDLPWIIELIHTLAKPREEAA